jgi:hypothetical protein
MLPEETLRHVSEVVGRECGACSLCCKLLHVVELSKPAGAWCRHCRPGAGGCSVHATRPDICRDFFCGWRLSKNVSDAWYPLRCHMILSLGVFDGVGAVTVTVDENHPLAWREPPWHGQLRQMAERGLRVDRQEDIRLTQVRVGGRVWLVLPDRDVEITRCSYVLKLVGVGQWDVEQYASSEQASARVSELASSRR